MLPLCCPVADFRCLKSKDVIRPWRWRTRPSNLSRMQTDSEWNSRLVVHVDLSRVQSEAAETSALTLRYLMRPEFP